MATRIRLARGGSKKKPFYRVVVADRRAPRDGNFIEKLGTYNPLLAKDSKDRFVCDLEKTKAWLAKGAEPSEKVATFLFRAGIVEAKKYLPAGYPKTEEERQKLVNARAEKIKAEADAKAAAEAEEASA